MLDKIKDKALAFIKYCVLITVSMSRLVSSTDYCPVQDVPTMEACRDLCLTAPYR